MKKILLVTADKDLVTMINNALTHYDVDVTVESNYNEAIETVQRESFDLLISFDSLTASFKGFFPCIAIFMCLVASAILRFLAL